MIIWLDAQLSPQLASWIAETFGGECRHIRDLNLRNADDTEIFQKARDAGSVVMTKDEDLYVSWSKMVLRRWSFGSLRGTCRMLVSNPFF